MTSPELTHPTLLHPRTGEPLRAIGLRPNGQPLWPIMGGDGTEPDANDAGDDTPPADEDEGDNPDQDGDTDEGADKDGDDSRVKRANRQAANYRTRARDAEQERDQFRSVLDGLRKVLDPDAGEGDNPDPTELAGRIESLSDENAELRRDLMVHDLAAEAGANPSTLLDSRNFRSSLKELDSEAEDYRDQVLRAMKSAVSKNAAFRAGQGSASGGAELDGDKREQKRKRPGSLSSAIGAAYGG